MSIDELIASRTIREIAKSLDDVHLELTKLTKPIKLVLSPDEKKKDELFNQVKDLRQETEELIKQMQGRRDLKVVKQITSRVKKIIEEKEQIKQAMKLLNIKG